MHCPSGSNQSLPGGRSSSLVGAPSMARSSISLLPTRDSAGLPVATGRGRAGGWGDAAVAAGRADGSSEVAVAATAASSVADAGGVVRGRVETRSLQTEVSALLTGTRSLLTSPRACFVTPRNRSGATSRPKRSVIRLLIVMSPTTPRIQERAGPRGLRPRGQWCGSLRSHPWEKPPACPDWVQGGFSVAAWSITRI